MCVCVGVGCRAGGRGVGGLDTLDRYSTIFYTRHNFCDLLFALLHTKSFLKKGPL